MTLQRTFAKGAKTPTHLSIDADPAGEILCDGAHASLLRASIKDAGYRLSTVRDLTYLRWRYGQLSEYRAIRSAPGGASGMVIFRTRRHGRFWVSHICELFAAHEDHRTVRHLTDRVRDAASTDFLSCSFPSRRSAALCGFVPYRSGKVVMVYPLQPNFAPDPTQRASWALSLGDLDLL